MEQEQITEEQNPELNQESCAKDGMQNPPTDPSMNPLIV